MKTWKIFWGIGLILAAAVLLLDAFGVITPFLDVVGGISAAQVICGLFLIAFVVSRIIKLKFHEIFIPLALLFMLFEAFCAFTQYCLYFASKSERSTLKSSVVVPLPVFPHISKS